MTYDNVGNLTADTYSGFGVTRVYDAENRMTSETQSGGLVAGSYTYDGHGQRVRRTLSGVETWQVFGMDGELLAEYAANSAIPLKEYGYRDGELLITAEPAAGAGETVWVEDSVPAGTAITGDAEGWNWISSSPAPFSGSLAHQSNIVAGLHQHYFYGATATMSLASGDKLVAYVYLDPSNVPGEIMLQWGDANWEHRAYWGANNLPWGVDGTESRRYMGPLPAAGSWVKLEVPASLVGLEGHTIHAMAFSMWGGRATWDRAGKSGGNATVNWLVTDHLGTPRMVVDKTGSLAAVKRHDYLPFGEELLSSQGLRSPALGYGNDGVRQKFTAQERDVETGLDYFHARYYASIQGRFTSADDFVNDTIPLDPASWNLYVYVRNNPLRFTDPTGELVYVGDVPPGDREELLRRLNFTYGCNGCVDIDANGFLTVNTTGLSQDVIKATQYLTDAITTKDPSKLFTVQMANNSSAVAFGNSQVGAAGVTLPGNNYKTSAILIRLDFGDDDAITGNESAKEAFLNTVFAHEVAHHYPNAASDPSDGRKTGAVVDAVNEILQARGLPLRAEYGAFKRDSGGHFVQVRFGKAQVDKDGKIKRTKSGGIAVEKTKKQITWIKTTVGGTGIN